MADKFPDEGDSPGEEAPVYELEVDQCCGYMIFDALERGTIHAAQAGAMDVAAEYVDTLFLLQTQEDDLTDDYQDTVDEVVEDDGPGVTEAFYAALSEVKQWAREEDHDVAEWFGEEVEDGLSQ